MTEKQFRKDVYEAYKLWWMLMHGYTLADYVNIIATADKERRSVGGYPVNDTDKIFDVLVRDAEDVGFEGGSLWVCEDEFFDTDIYNAGEMDSIFSVMWSGEECREFWQKTYGSDSGETREEVIEVETSAGMLKAYPSTDPDQPGICVMYQPAGFEDEIDAAFVSVYENPEYAREGERPEDVVIMSYGDATTEDYTTKEIIRREDVIAGLGNAVNEMS